MPMPFGSIGSDAGVGGSWHIVSDCPHPQRRGKLLNGPQDCGVRDIHTMGIVVQFAHARIAFQTQSLMWTCASAHACITWPSRVLPAFFTNRAISLIGT